MADAKSRHPNRRHILVGGAALSVLRGDALAEPKQQQDARAKPEQNSMEIALVVNETPYRVVPDIRTTLLDALREHIGLTGSKKGCDHGQCGACTVLVGGKRVLSCLTLAVAVRRPVTTIEGIVSGDKLHPLQQAFMEVRCVPMRLLYAGTNHVGHRLRHGGTRGQRRPGARVYKR